METGALLTSYRQITRYAITRLVTVRIIALATLLTVASLWASASQTPSDLGWIAIFSYLLICQFRLWDDLADREFDRLHHPGRILVTSSDTRPFFVALIALFLANATWISIWQPLPRLTIYVLLVASLGILYQRKAWIGQWRLLRMQVVLMKYPIFLFLCTKDEMPNRLFIAGLAIYLLLSSFDLLSDETLDTTSARRWLIAIECAALVITLVTYTWPIHA